MLQHVAQPSAARPIPPAYVAKRERDDKPVPRRWATKSRAQLLASGWSPRRITAAVRTGLLIRARENVYLDPDAPDDCVAACAVGGRLTCVSELARWGVFVLDGADLHVDVRSTASRLRMPDRSVRVHWTQRPALDGSSVDVVHALVDAVRCQSVRAAIATLDSALNLRLIGAAELDEVFAALPRRLRVLRSHLDGAAESGAESFMRLLLRRLGCRVESQRRIPGVGRVDFLVDGWLIVECDSEAHHSSWKQQKKDRRRDQAAAARGFVTYRALAEDIFWHQELVVDAVRGLLRHRGRA